MTSTTAPPIHLLVGWVMTSIVESAHGSRQARGQAVLPIEANRLANSGAIAHRT